MRDAALECLQEFYKELGQPLLENLINQNIRPAVFKEVIARLDKWAPTGITVPEGPAATSAAPGSLAAAAGGHRRSGTGRETAEEDPGTWGSRSSCSAGSGAGAAPAAPAARRGGYKDAGGIGDLPEAVPIPLSSEKELYMEVEAMVVPLSGLVVDWQQRIAHMQRLQGLALGCSTNPGLLEALPDALKQLKDPLTKQVSSGFGSSPSAPAALCARLPRRSSGPRPNMCCQSCAAKSHV